MLRFLKGNFLCKMKFGMRMHYWRVGAVSQDRAEAVQALHSQCVGSSPSIFSLETYVPAKALANRHCTDWNVSCSWALMCVMLVWEPLVWGCSVPPLPLPVPSHSVTSLVSHSPECERKLVRLLFGWFFFPPIRCIVLYMDLILQKLTSLQYCLQKKKKMKKSYRQSYENL